MDAALVVARALAPLTDTHPASQQLACLLAFWSGHARPIADDDPGRPASVAPARRSSTCCRRLPPCTRRTTIPPGRSMSSASPCVDGLRTRPSSPDSQRQAAACTSLDDQAVRYGDFDDVAIVGVVDQDWPERPRRNIFYPPALLKALGWPSEKDRRAAGDARFLDLLTSASPPYTVSTFTLDEDAIVSRSMQLDEIPRARLSTVAREPFEDARIFADEALSLEPIAFDPFRATLAVGRDADEALARRCARLPRRGPRRRAARLVRERDRDVPGLPVQVLRAARAEARGGARGSGSDGSAAPGPVRAHRVRAVLRRVADAPATAR